MDRTDLHIARVLSEEGRITFEELGQRVHLSSNATADRVRRLIADGIIEGFHARLGLRELGCSLIALIDLSLRDGSRADEFRERLPGVPQVIWAAHLTGEHDYQLRVACRDSDDLERVIERLKTELGVRSTHTRLVLAELPVPQIPGSLMNF